VFILKVLGGAAIEGPDGPVAGRPAQKRRLALLSLLAMSPGNRLGREKLIAYLWPERDGDSARHLLSDAVYVINRALGADTLTGAGDEIRLHPERLACDARAFERTLDTDPEAGIRLYAGPFLEGFFLDGSEEFEAWVTRERERLSAAFASGLERAAVSREERGDERGAVDAWRRLASEDPYNSRVAVLLARALDRSGDRAGALQSARAHAALLKKDLGLHPTAELRDLMLELQRPPAVAPAEAPPSEPPPPARAADDLSPAPAPARPHRSLAWGAAAAAVLLALVAIPLWPSRSGSVSTARSVAVMPFEEVGSVPEGRYLGDAIADELTTMLGRAADVKVAARTSAFALKGRQMDAREIGRALGVDSLLEGSVQFADNRVRVAVRLVNAADGYQVWSDAWERPYEELRAIQDEIGGRVLAAMGASQPATPAPAASVPSAAYHLYLQGRYLWHQRTRESLLRAAETFEQATKIAPAYAQAFSGLADAYAVLGFYDYLPPVDAFPRAKAAARRALDLDPGLAEAHASLGYVALYYEWNWPAAEASFQRAIALNPSYSVGHQWYGNHLTARGRFDEAVRTMRRAQEVDPLSLIASAALGWVHFYAREYEAAADQCRRTLALNPNFELAHLWAGWADEAAGRFADARAHLEEAVRLSSEGAVALASLGRTQALSGDAAAARQTLARLQAVHGRYLPAYELAKLHLALGDRDRAMEWLERALAERSHSIAFLGVDPQLDALRSDPRFTALEARVRPLE
jgi:TolB-like protein/DNA-binding SARP family transcriptional activator/Tfp pilus assembly protein PilF